MTDRLQKATYLCNVQIKQGDTTMETMNFEKLIS